MPETNPIQQAFFAQQAGISPEQYKSLLSANQQEAMAQALLQQGVTPISTEGRSIGGVGYKISPWEGVSKLASALGGQVVQNSANDKLAAALAPQPGSQQPQQASRLPPDLQATYNRLSMPESMGGNPRAAVQLLNDFAGPAVQGSAAYNQALAQAAAGQAPVGTPFQGMSSQPVGGGQAAPPVTPVQGPAPVPPPPGAGGMNVPPAGVPSINASALQPNTPAPPVPAAPLPPVLRPMPGESNEQFSLRQKSAAAGATTEAEDTGKNLADATKTFNVAASNLPRAMQRFSELRQAAANASSGAGVSDQEPEQGILGHILPGPDWARSVARTFPESWVNPKVALANQKIDQATKQGVLAELGPQMQGLKGNKYLESIANGASGLNPSDPAPVKIQAINGLQDQYISNMVSLANQRTAYGDPTVPKQSDIAQMISQNAEPTYEVHILHPDGTLGTVKARSLMRAVQAGSKIQ